MNNKANIVPVEGHRGPHRHPYHEFVYDALTEAVNEAGPSRHEKREALIAKLGELGELIKTPGTKLNSMITEGYCEPAD